MTYYVLWGVLATRSGNRAEALIKDSISHGSSNMAHCLKIWTFICSGMDILGLIYPLPDQLTIIVVLVLLLMFFLATETAASALNSPALTKPTDISC